MWDTELKGFGVRMMPSGVGTYVLKYRNLEGRQRKSGITTPAAPGPVTQLAAGTPTSSTIPITYTAPATGGAATGYLIEYQPSGGAFTTAASGVTATSYTITGLSAATAYTVRVTASNAGGSISGVTTTATTAAASSQDAFPLTMTNATYGTGKFGQALTGGSGTATVTAIAGQRRIGLWFNSLTAPTTFVPLMMEPGGQHGIGVSQFGVTLWANGAHTEGGSTAIYDGAWHFIEVIYHDITASGNDAGANIWVDGANLNGTGIGTGRPANPTYIITAAGGAGSTGFGAGTGIGAVDGAFVIGATGNSSTVPTAPYTSATPNLAAAWNFEGNGASQ